MKTFEQMLQVQQHTAVNTIVGSQIATNHANDEKGGGGGGAYRFDVSQPFSYNYALVNQMSLAAAASTATFKCDICGLVFAHLSLLNHHKRLHATAGQNAQQTAQNAGPNPGQASAETTTGRVFTCDICGANYGQAVDLKAHKQSAHTGVLKPGKCCSSCGVEIHCDHAANKKKLKFLKCANCEEEIAEREAAASAPFEGTHEVATETEENSIKTIQPGMATVTKCHKCNGSGILFVGGVQTTVEKPFHCNICEGTFSRYSSLWSHKRLHSGDKPFKCEFCGVAFARAAYLKNHSRIHSGERPFKCDVCGMQFSQAPHLKNHERIHSGERPYECEICNKTFARHSTLWNHRRIHTGEKPYRCNVCGSAFNQATHLKNHAKVKIHILDGIFMSETYQIEFLGCCWRIIALAIKNFQVHTGEKPHRCDICEVGFSDRFALKRHRGIHEKYGQTASTNQASQQQQQQQPQQQQQGTQADGRLDELYKCDVTAGIAFPGCSRPQEAK
ncbi:unnamed protein product [Nesidiocoris tenuis]|uniref:C2H2-type domain-containing protein n=1 Tax=Nesidiocoris tenuis TaxID=355587 RepID=A0A6H5G2Z6_9HEMI|nr:unnamed protein product [Nesidiocoris tenuis]